MSNDDLELLEQYLDGSIADFAVPRLEKILLDSHEARATLRTLATLDLGLHEIALVHNQDSVTKSILPMRTTSSSASRPWAKSMLVLSSLVIVGLATALWLRSNPTGDEPVADRNVATVTGISGEIIWTGNGGAVFQDLKQGTKLTGGTIEGTSPTSWVELEFHDGSRVTVAGDSRLTFSDFGQKLLYLKEGNVSSSVEPQSPDAPMLVYTRNAMLEVLGTEFNVESDVDAISLNVTEGKVRFRRLSDGETVEVPANQRVRSSDGISLVPQPIPARASQWRSNLNQPYCTHGKWLPRTETLPPRLELVHYRHKTPVGQSFMIKNAGMAVLGKDGERVGLSPVSKIRIRGYAKQNQKAVFGVVTRNSNGDFAGYYSSSVPNTFWMNLQTENGGVDADKLQPFEVVVDVADLVLGADLQKANQSFAALPAGLVVDWVYCSSPSDESDLEIAEFEIFRGDAD